MSEKHGLSKDDSLLEYVSLKSAFVLAGKSLMLTEYRGEVLSAQEFYDRVTADKDISLSKNCREYVRSMNESILRPEKKVSVHSICALCPFYRFSKNKCTDDEYLLLRYMFEGLGPVRHIARLSNGNPKTLFHSCVDLAYDLGVDLSARIPVIVDLPLICASLILKSPDAFSMSAPSDGVGDAVLNSRFEYLKPSLIGEVGKKASELQDIAGLRGFDIPSVLSNELGWFREKLFSYAAPTEDSVDRIYEHILGEYDSRTRRNNAEKLKSQKKNKSSALPMFDFISSLDSAAGVGDSTQGDKGFDSNENGTKPIFDKIVIPDVVLDSTNAEEDEVDDLQDMRGPTDAIPVDIEKSIDSSGEFADRPVNTGSSLTTYKDYHDVNVSSKKTVSEHISSGSSVYLPLLPADIPMLDPEFLSGLCAVADATKVLPAEIAVTSQGDYYLVLLDALRGEFSCVEVSSNLPGDLIRLLKSNKVVKVCWQSYYIYSLFALEGLRVRNVHSIFAYERVVGMTGLHGRSGVLSHYRDIWRKTGKCLLPDIVDELLDYMRYYGQALLIQSASFRNNTRGYNEILKSDAFIGRSFLRNTCLFDDSQLLSVNDSEIVYNPDYVARPKEGGFVFTYSITNLPPATLSWVMRGALVRMEEVELPDLNGIQLLYLDDTVGVLHLYVRSPYKDYVDTQLMTYFDEDVYTVKNINNTFHTDIEIWNLDLNYTMLQHRNQSAT